MERKDYAQSSDKHRDHLQELLRRFDTDGDGITTDELAQILEKCDSMTAATKRMMKKRGFCSKRRTRTSRVQFSSAAMLNIMMECGVGPNVNLEAKAVFEAADADNDGEIDMDEFGTALTRFCTLKLASDAQKLMDAADQDGSGKLDFDEFHDAVVNHASSDDGSTMDFGMLVRHKELADIRDAATGLFLLVFLLYPSLTNKIFAGLSCRSLATDYSVLYADYSLECGSFAYVTMAVVCVVLVLIWPVGVPMGLYYMMWKEKAEILSEDEAVLGKFGFALGDYNTRHWYWER